MNIIPVTKDGEEQGILILDPERGFAYVPSEFLIFRNTEAEAIEAQKKEYIRHID